MMQNWMLFLLAVILCLSPIAAVVGMVMMYHSQTRLLRLISERSGIPAINMETAKVVERETVKLPERKKISIPIPGSQNFRKS
jgi:hypothetical protein